MLFIILILSMIWLAFPREVIKFLQLLFFPNILTKTGFVFPLTFLQIPRIHFFVEIIEQSPPLKLKSVPWRPSSFQILVHFFLQILNMNLRALRLNLAVDWCIIQSLDLDPFPLLKKVKNIIPDYWYFQPYFPSFTWCFLETSI